MHPTLSRNKKGEGLVSKLVLGVTGLVIITIIALVIVSTLSSSDLFTTQRVSGTATNESQLSQTSIVYANQTGYALAKANSSTTGWTITAVWREYNQTTSTTNLPAGAYNITIPLTNVSVDASGNLKNTTITHYANISVSYTYTLYSDVETASNRMIANLSSGVNNISSKVPTILLVGIIVILLGVLALLFTIWKNSGSGGDAI